jgi:hypothetical protein
VRVRLPGSELRARYHRVRADQPITGVRLARGVTTGGLQVSLFREPLPTWLVFACWAAVLAAAAVGDAWLGQRGTLGLSATPPVVLSALSWSFITPAAGLEAAVRAILMATFSGPIIGYGLAMIAEAAWRRARST